MCTSHLVIEHLVLLGYVPFSVLFFLPLSPSPSENTHQTPTPCPPDEMHVCMCVCVCVWLCPPLTLPPFPPPPCSLAEGEGKVCSLFSLVSSWASVAGHCFF